jgi:large subunit ribosomal protein L22
MTQSGYFASTTLNSTPRKARLVADLVRGLDVQTALNTLANTNKKSAKAIAKAIKSACANGAIISTGFSQVRIVEIKVDEFSKLKRSMPRGKGSAAPFWRRWSKVSLKVS